MERTILISADSTDFNLRRNGGSSIYIAKIAPPYNTIQESLSGEMGRKSSLIGITERIRSTGILSLMEILFGLIHV